MTDRGSSRPDSLPAEPGVSPDAVRDTRCPPVRSEQLLQGRRLVEIVHNGEVYRLQATRLGKLILTK